ncbi:MAG: HlyD family type I secretion periplasmic adaptor subunit [Alphaproteobacteria bacterium]
MSTAVTISPTIGTGSHGDLEAMGLPPAPPVRGLVLAATAVVAIFFGLGGGWAALAPLSTAAVSPGTVTVEGNRKTVQHLEGGIIKDIRVRDGDVVTAGQPLLTLEDAQARSNWQLVQGQHDALKALESRLVAERDDKADIAFPEGLLARINEPTVRDMVDGQRTIFDGRRRSLTVETDILRRRVEQLAGEVRSRLAQVRSAETQANLTRSELKDAKELVSGGLERRPRLLSLQREEARLEGLVGEQTALIAAARQKIGESELQINSLRSTRLNEVATDLRKTQTELADVGERLRAARDVLERRDIVAPIAGTVVNLRFFTAGGVIGPGLPILDIVPSESRLIVESRINQTDIQAMRVGLPAVVHLTAFKQRTTPQVAGRVIYVAADVTADEKSGQAHYVVRTEIPRLELARLKGLDLVQGMPAQVMIVTGERTLFQYLMAPLTESFTQAFREK